MFFDFFFSIHINDGRDVLHYFGLHKLFVYFYIDFGILVNANIQHAFHFHLFPEAINLLLEEKEKCAGSVIHRRSR